MTRSPPENLGYNLLLITNNHPACLDMVRTVVQQLGELELTTFTLFHCCPPAYWEHGGGDEEALRQDQTTVRQREENARTKTAYYFEQSRAILQDAGVPADHIRTKRVTDADNTVEAITRELRVRSYSGLIVGPCHRDLASWLRVRRFLSLLRNDLPQFAIWVIDPEPAPEA